MRLIKGC